MWFEVVWFSYISLIPLNAKLVRRRRFVVVRFPVAFHVLSFVLVARKSALVDGS